MMRRYPSYEEKIRKQAEGIAFCEKCFKWKGISEFKLFNGGYPTATCQECYKPFKARAIINRKLKEGTLIKPLICEGCGKKVESAKSIVAHHPDYNKPEYIQFLCGKCHFDAHKEIKQAKKKILEWWSNGGHRYFSQGLSMYYDKLTRRTTWTRSSESGNMRHLSGNGDAHGAGVGPGCSCSALSAGWYHTATLNLTTGARVCPRESGHEKESVHC